jgi:hypothetical protein
MQTDKELMDLIKKSCNVSPRTEFVYETEVNLKKMARKMSSHNKIKRIAISGFTLLVGIVAFSLFYLLNTDNQLFNGLTSGKNTNSAFKSSLNETSVFIYQSKNYESFLPNTKTKDGQESFNKINNITDVAARLTKSLEEKNIKVAHDQTDVMGFLKKTKSNEEQYYQLTKPIVQNALKKYKIFN